MTLDAPQQVIAANRRQFFGRSATGIGVAALASLLNGNLLAAPAKTGSRIGGLDGLVTADGSSDG